MVRSLSDGPAVTTVTTVTAVTAVTCDGPGAEVDPLYLFMLSGSSDFLLEKLGQFPFPTPLSSTELNGGVYFLTCRKLTSMTNKLQAASRASPGQHSHFTRCIAICSEESPTVLPLLRHCTPQPYEYHHHVCFVLTRLYRVLCAGVSLSSGTRQQAVYALAGPNTRMHACVRVRAPSCAHKRMQDRSL